MQELCSKVVAEGESGVSWGMGQITLPTQKARIRYARTYSDSLSPAPATTAAPSLTEVFRQGAQRLFAQAIAVAVALLFAPYADRREPQGRQALVRNGALPDRDIPTGSGAVRGKVPRGRERSGAGRRWQSAATR
jgi:hypothetical protein